MATLKWSEISEAVDIAGKAAYPLEQYEGEQPFLVPERWPRKHKLWSPNARLHRLEGARIWNAWAAVMLVMAVSTGGKS